MDHVEFLGGLFFITGNGPEWAHWKTRSWTRLGIWHEIHLAKRDGIDYRVGDVFCRCEDAMCRKKQPNVFEGCRGGCKHARGLFFSVLKRYVEDAIREQVKL